MRSMSKSDTRSTPTFLSKKLLNKALYCRDCRAATVCLNRNSLGESWQPLSLDQVRKIHILRMLEHCQGNRERAARALGIGRTSLYRYLKLELESSTHIPPHAVAELRTLSSTGKGAEGGSTR